MDNRPATLGERVPRKAEKNAIRETASAGHANAFLNFRYSYTEISALSSVARVKSRNVRFKDGKLTDESFEGEMDRSVYEHNVAQAHQFFLGQADVLMKSLATMLSFWQPERPNRR